MSCNTQTSQAIRLTVSVGNFPEGYCPSNYQQFASDLAARLIVTPNQNNSTFVTGSVEPTSNVGPWLKDCLEWFVFDDATGRYRPVTKGGFTNFQQFVSSGTFVVPSNIYYLMVEGWGAGGGGGNQAAGNGGGGGGGGGYGVAFFNVVPNQALAVTVGGGGAAGAAGGNSSISTLTVNGGSAGTAGANPANGGQGGTVTGAASSTNGGTGTAASADNATGRQQGPGGSSPKGGQGGVPNTISLAGIAPGGGGCGGVSSLISAGAFPAVGGAGADGRIIVWY